MSLHRKISVLLLFAIIFFIIILLLLSLNYRSINIADANSSPNSVIIEVPNLSDDFDDSCVMVIMDENTGKINREYSINYFGNCEISYIEDLTYVSGEVADKQYLNNNGFKQILKLNLKINSKQSVLDTLNALKSVQGISWAGPNYFDSLNMNDIIYPMSNIDNIYSEQWGLHGEYGIDAPNLWRITEGNDQIKVGIIDSGIANHADLQVNLVEGWDFVNNNSITTDDIFGHGTHVAGIIGAVAANGIRNGVSGVCPNVQLVPLQVTNNEGKWGAVYYTMAINWAINNNIDIINYSGGGSTDYEPRKAALENYQGLYICAAGNSGSDNDINPFYPSDYSQNQVFSERVISVGAIDSDGSVASFSNYGKQSVTIFAPGVSILSTVPTTMVASGYQTKSGTSMATPFTTGVAALMFSMCLNFEFDSNIDVSHAEIASIIKNKIIETATYQSNLQDKCVASGRLNGYEAVRLFDVFNTTELNVDTIRIDGLKYQYNGELTIPKKIGGKSVTQIGNGAFANQTGITKVYVPSTVETIGANAFENCTQMQYIEFDEGSQLTTIGNSAFSGSGLWNIVFPSTVNNIGFNAFQNCQTLMAVEFKQGCLLDAIGNATFSGCANLLAITIPASVKTIGANAFENCNFATRCDFMQGSQLETIGNSAFANTKIQNFAIPTGVTYIGSNAFYGCSEMETIVIPGGVQTVGVTAFGNCENLTIYTSLSNTPSGWVGGWNSLNRPVVLNCQLQNGYVLSFAKTDSNPFNANAANGLNNPYRSNYDFGGWYTTSDFSGTKYENISNAPNGTLYVKWTQKESCVAEGTMITLADGTQKPVEQLTGNEMLLVWNMFTGSFDSAPILFIDSDPYAEYEITRLSFSDGTQVKLIYEHGFWDFDLNKYVYLRNDAAQYIGHTFNKQTEDESGNPMWTAVELVAVDVYTEYTTAWSPVTYGHLCYYVNGMLSMPGGITGLFNIFDVDGETLKVDEESMAADIAEYGLYTYEEFAQECPVPQEMFEAVNGQYLKVAIGKGNITMEEIIALAQRYAEFFYCNNAE